MSRENRPAFLLYASDWLSGTADMTLEEQGIYMKMLCQQWLKGGLPTDEEKLFRMIFGPESASESLANRKRIANVSLKFRLQIIDGREVLANDRLEEIRNEARQKFQNRSAANAENARRPRKKQIEDNLESNESLTNCLPFANESLTKKQRKEDEDEYEYIQQLDTEDTREHANYMSSITQLNGENQNFGFDAEKRYRQFQEAYGKPGKYQSALRAYVAAILHLGRAPTHYPPIAAAKLLEDQAAASRLYDVRTEQTKRCNPETWLENQSYLTDWKSALDTYLNDRNTQEEHGNPKKRGNDLLNAASEYTKRLPPI